MRDASVLVFANKQDLPNAMTTSEITEKLGLSQLRNRTVSIWNLESKLKLELEMLEVYLSNIILIVP